MAFERIWQAGGESGSTDEFSSINHGGRFTAVTEQVNTGSYGFKVTPYTSIGTQLPHGIVNIPATREIRGGYYMYGSASMVTWDLTFNVRHQSGTLLGIDMSGSSNTYAWRLDIGGSKEEQVSPLTEVTWYHVGFDVKIHPTAGWFYVYKNGVLVMSFDGNTGDSDIAQMRVGHIGYDDQGATYYFDDIYVDDSTGEDATVPPILRFFPALANGNGNYSQWVGSDGNSTDNYQLVDEVPISTADYVETISGLKYDSYTTENYSIKNGQTIHAVIPMVHADRQGSSEELHLGTRYSGNDVVVSGQDLILTPTIVHTRQATKPGGGAWDQAALNNFEIVIKSEGSY